MSEERKLILKMLHENRISVDEADQLISALENKSAPGTGSSGTMHNIQREAQNIMDKTGPKMEQFMGGLSSMIESVSHQLGPNLEKRFEGWFQQRATANQQASSREAATRQAESSRSEVNFPLEPGIQKLRCFHWLGEIKVEGSEGSEIQAVLEKQILTERVEQKLKFDELRLVSRQEGPLMMLELAGADGLKPNDGTVKLVLKLPSKLDLDLRTESHDISLSKLSNTQGQIRLESQSGDLELRDTAIKRLDLHSQSGDIYADQASELIVIQSQSGNLKLKGTVYEGQLSTMSGQAQVEASINHLLKLESRSGDLNVQMLDGRGRLELRSQSGDIELTGSVRSEAGLHTMSGDLHCDLLVEATGAAQLTSHSGDLDLILRPASECKLDLSASSGEIECRLELQQREQSEHALRGVLGSGEGSLRLQTESGDILVS